MFKALVIGCGNIGALYDFNNDQIQTHVKAYHSDPRFSLAIFDINKTIIKKIYHKYKCEVVESINKEILSKFDCVSICTSTDTHFQFLKMAIESEVKVILCEKPISNDINELDEVKSLVTNLNSKVIVNYIRRFQPSFFELKEVVSKIFCEEELTNLSIRYQRGFINNCSHALDTIEFLTDSEMILTEIKKHNVIYDQFNNDPTLSLQAIWNKTNVNIVGLSNVCFSHFEIDLYFQYSKICIKNAGQIIEVYKSEKSEQFLQPLVIQGQFTREQCLKNYMSNVINQVFLLLNNEKQEDNFLQSISLNQRILNYINL